MILFFYSNFFKFEFQTSSTENANGEVQALAEKKLKVDVRDVNQSLIERYYALIEH